MKKLICLVLILIFVATTYASELEPTVKRNAFEFSDLYIRRLEEFEDLYGIDISQDLKSADYCGMGNVPFYEENVYVVEIPAGTLFVSIPDFNIVRADTLVKNYQPDDDKYTRSIAQAAMFCSALEHNSYLEYKTNTLRDLDPSRNQDFITFVYEDFFNIYTEAMNNPDYVAELFSENGTTLPLCSGNYKYELQYIRTDLQLKDFEYVYLIATARE